jgi:Holliday junction resolvasome RuvABC ATP-dependent DNA helicase subunit
MTPKEIIENRIGRMFHEVIDQDFAFIDECETIADYIEEHLYDTLLWQLPIEDEDIYQRTEDIDNYNEVHATAMNQVIAILASRFFYKTNTNSER